MADEPVNIHHIREATMNDEEFIRELIDVFLDDSPRQLDALRRAVENRQVQDVAETAHRLKGAGSNMGAESLSALCGRLEEAGRQQQSEPMPAIFEQLDQEFARVKEFFINYRCTDE